MKKRSGFVSNSSSSSFILRFKEEPTFDNIKGALFSGEGDYVESEYQGSVKVNDVVREILSECCEDKGRTFGGIFNGILSYVKYCDTEEQRIRELFDYIPHYVPEENKIKFFFAMIDNFFWDNKKKNEGTQWCWRVSISRLLLR